MRSLVTTFVLGYHGCEAAVAKRLVSGQPFKPSDNDYDWLGPGVYFWEANPLRALEFAQELKAAQWRKPLKQPAVVGAVIELGECLDATTASGAGQISEAFKAYEKLNRQAGTPLASNSPDLLRRNLDCAVIRTLHGIRENAGGTSLDTLRGVFVEGKPLYAGPGFYAKTHIQLCVRNFECIKAVFYVPNQHLE